MVSARPRDLPAAKPPLDVAPEVLSLQGLGSFGAKFSLPSKCWRRKQRQRKVDLWSAGLTLQTSAVTFCGSFASHVKHCACKACGSFNPSAAAAKITKSQQAVSSATRAADNVVCHPSCRPGRRDARLRRIASREHSACLPLGCRGTHEGPRSTKESAS